MTKFKVGDRVRCIRAAYSDLRQDAEYTVKGFNNCDLRLEGVAISWDQARFEKVDNELEQLRQFKADAIAKHPDLAPMSEEDKAILDMASKARWETTGAKFSSLTDIPNRTVNMLREAIQWGRDHAN